MHMHKYKIVTYTIHVSFYTEHLLAYKLLTVQSVALRIGFTSSSLSAVSLIHADLKSSVEKCLDEGVWPHKTNSE